ncbi:CinA family protein [Erythrobacteraceae bacterium CFH 75059]|nr:CinA family protein [Erythrobacteraceae bacterium CFH 75059]
MAEVLDAVLEPGAREQAQRVIERVRDAELRLATAESCTAGLLAAVLTDVEGCGHVFDRGFVTYELTAKCDMLDLPEEIVQHNAAVNEAVARLMAERTLARSEAHIAIGITGFAGPCEEDQEEGLVFIGCAAQDRETQVREEHFGEIGRAAVRAKALAAAFEMIAEATAALQQRRA